MYGHVDVVNVLIENGVNVDATNNYWWTVLHEAAWYEYVNVAKILIENRINVNGRRCIGLLFMDMLKLQRF